MDLLRLTIYILVLTECYQISEAMGICKFARKFPPKEGDSSLSTKSLALLASSCPPNMVNANWTPCQETCLNPIGCITNCAEPQTCVCPNGFLLNGDNCVREEMWEYFIAEKGAIPANQTYVNADCSEKCVFKDGFLSCNSSYRCSYNETCSLNDGIRRCYCNDGYAGDGETCVAIHRDCYDAYLAGNREDGVYTILPEGWMWLPFNVYCDMSTAGGGWTVFHRRTDGVTDFYRYWEDYKHGFGCVDQGRDFWLGNDKLFFLTNQKGYRLRVDIVTSDGTYKYEEYEYFLIGNESTKYRLSIGSFEGNASNGIKYANGSAFSTRDQDNDACIHQHCAEGHRGAFWYTSHWCRECRYINPLCYRFQNSSNCHNVCTASNLNGNYNQVNGTNIFWAFQSNCYLNSAEMKLRPYLF